ncbi:hypothetical protein EV143_11058 [Flavobacterium chryseum]|uniref:hypothetical protein n=1 Tax=Flavobacterium sp. P3160 TaxID=2512113 RepID=UPI00105DCDC1|nr:hypothetical protein [Flavobacterium sp. P3160]TDO71066.1 hypothetical protein EV143_11058 [Flavobacterium sp. P3160]
MCKPTCYLCKIEIADKKNSHIIPKFLGKELFISDLGNHAIQIDRDGKCKKIQTIPKEDFILCVSCEKRFEIIETFFARFFTKLRDFENFTDNFDIRTLGNQNYIVCKKLNPKLFKLFIYSLIWRLSISTHFANQKYKLPIKIEEELRTFLDRNLKIDHTSLISTINEVENIPNYDFCLIKPENKFADFKGMHSAFQISKSIYLLALVDFIIFFYIDDSIDPVLKIYSNKQNNDIIIPISEDERWFALNKLILSKILNTQQSRK